jgi:hypothetical protein
MYQISFFSEVTQLGKTKIPYKGYPLLHTDTYVVFLSEENVWMSLTLPKRYEKVLIREVKMYRNIGLGHILRH